MNPLRSLILIIGVSLASSLFAQNQSGTSDYISAGDIRQEQRQIQNAYLGDANAYIKVARERLGVGNNRLAQQSGLWALEQLAYAKRKLERHAPKIEEVRTWIGARVSESTRKELRDSYAKVRQQYVDTEEKLDILAQALQKAGFGILSEALDNVRSSSGDGAVNAALQGLQKAGVQGKGDMGGPVPTVAPSADVPPAAAAATTVAIGNSGLQGTVGPNGVTIGSTVIPGTYDAASNTIQSPQYGRVQLGTAQTNAQGVTFLQTDKGVLVVPPGTLIPGATLNPDGTIRFADGSTASINDVSAANGVISVNIPGKGQVTLDPNTGMPVAAAGMGAAAGFGGADSARGFNGNPRGTLVDANGNPITVDGDAPPFQNGERTFIRRVYIGARDTILQRETKVTQRLMEASGSNWKVEETLGESRSWSLSVDLQNAQKGSGKLTGTLVVVDAGGVSDFSVSSMQVEDDAGQKAAVQKAGAGFSVTFTKSGDYTAIAEGSTNWGSRFRLEATFPVGVQ